MGTGFGVIFGGQKNTILLSVWGAFADFGGDENFCVPWHAEKAHSEPARKPARQPASQQAWWPSSHPSSKASEKAQQPAKKARKTRISKCTWSKFSSNAIANLMFFDDFSKLQGLGFRVCQK